MAVIRSRACTAAATVRSEATSKSAATRAAMARTSSNLVRNAVELAPVVASLLQADVMFGIGPVDADESLELLVRWRCHVNLRK